MNVESEMCFVKGESKVFSPTASLASPSARGVKRTGEAVVNVTEPDGIPIVPIHQRDRMCHVLIESAGRGGDGQDGSAASSFRFEVHFDRLEGELLGLSSSVELRDVVITCGGHKACGWHLGVASVTAGGEPVETSQRLFFQLRPYFGKRCTQCLDPIYAIGYACHECEMTNYCSRDCMNRHMRRHGLLCPILKEKYRFKSGTVATEVSDDTALVAWWRCQEGGRYSILVDSTTTLGCSMEFSLSTMRSAKEEGLQYSFITRADQGGAASPPLPRPDEVVDFACVLLREVNRSAVLEGCVSLAAACLNHLFVFSPSSEITTQAHVLFFTAFHCDDVMGYISTVEEYVSYARPLHSFVVSQIENALKSTIAGEFWRRMKIAKDVGIALFHLNDSELRPPATDELRSILVSQQLDTLLLLSRVFLTMASRASREEAHRLLEQGEKCLRQCFDVKTASQEVMAKLHFRLAAYLLLYGKPEKNEDAKLNRAEGERLLREMPGRVARQQSGVESVETKAPVVKKNAEGEVKA